MEMSKAAERSAGDITMRGREIPYGEDNRPPEETAGAAVIDIDFEPIQIDSDNSVDEVPEPDEFKVSDIYLTFDNLEYQRQYTAFLMRETSVRVPLTVAILTYFIYLSHSVVQIQHPHRTDLSLEIARHVRTLTIVLVAMYVYCIAKARRPSLPDHPFNVTYLGNATLFIHALATGVIILSRSLIGNCSDSQLGCNPAAKYNSIPLDAFMFCAYSMVAVPVFIKCHSWIVNLLSIVIMTFLIFASLIQVRADVDTFVSAFLFCLSITLTIYEYERYRLKTFVGYLTLQKSLAEKASAKHEKTVILKHTQELRHLIGNVAHDLKTPVQSMVSELDLMESLKLGTEATTSIKLLNSTCVFMTMMINRSLDYMKSTSGLVLVPRMETVSLMECMEWAVDCIGPRRDKLPIVIEALAADVHPFVITDKQWMAENLLCLISNAVKFVTEGSISVRVNLLSKSALLRRVAKRLESEHDKHCNSMVASAVAHYNKVGIEPTVTSGSVAQEAEESYYLVVEVEDTGIGIDPKVMKQLFRPFKQAQRNCGGTGLGLFALSKRVDSIGGSCGVRGRRDGRRGSLFWFSIPYRPDTTLKMKDYPSPVLSSAGNISTLSSIGTQWVGEVRKSKKRVLVVDDSLLIQKTTTRSLEREGFVVRVASNGVECLAALKEEGPFSLVLLDINMPVMDGIETIKRIRSDEAEGGQARGINAKRQLVIGISANSDADTREQALSGGMDAFLEKPVKMKELKSSAANVGLLF